MTKSKEAKIYERHLIEGVRKNEHGNFCIHTPSTQHYITGSMEEDVVSHQRGDQQRHREILGVTSFYKGLFNHQLTQISSWLGFCVF
jgi:hypothetical protein